ncbi:acetolactate decarboxylase [Thiohalocapsa marina]|uniref:Alpha-acetolactate decarboxylase n=2 Tax=Thiohalocapsa marina TaxID=424902 RepID=A0A5M8FJM4_9GAMM|nr:acetolactate decarboxylase [Thiohalocapsa marina]
MLPLLLALSATVQSGGRAEGQVERGRDTLYQVSTIDALLDGVYGPMATLADVLPHGDVGIGTFEALDGELILLDGQVYQAAADGVVRPMPPETATPFIAVTHFDADQSLTPPAGQDFAGFKTWLEAALPSRNIVYAIRVDGHFGSIRYRSVPRQQTPYPPLAEAAREQVFFARDDIEGTLIGFWCPSFTKGVNVPGFHLHFLSADRRHGGHVLDFTLAEAAVQLDHTNGWDVQLPMQPAFLASDLGADRSEALHAVEQGRPAPAD